MFAWFFWHVPHLAVYLLTGYTIGKMANALWRDKRPNKELPALTGKLIRMLFFPITYHNWADRESSDYQGHSGDIGTLRCMAGDTETDPKRADKELDERYCQWLMLLWPIKVASNLVMSAPQIIWFSTLYFPRTVWNFFANTTSLSGLAAKTGAFAVSLKQRLPGLKILAKKVAEALNQMFFEPVQDDSLGAQVRQLKKLRETELQAPKERLTRARQAADDTLKLVRERILKTQELMASKPGDSRAWRQCSRLLDIFKAREQEQAQELADIDALIAEVAEQEQTVSDQFQLLDLYDGAETLSDDINTQAREAVAAAMAAMETLKTLAGRASDIQVKATVQLDTPLDSTLGQTADEFETLAEPSVPLQKVSR